MGDDFVRLTKFFGSEEMPGGKHIGKGLYDYTVGIFNPDETEVATGAKVSFSRSISW